MVCSNRKAIKDGFLLEDVKTRIKPLDIVFFNGSDSISDFIKYVQKRSLKDSQGNLIKPGEFSHVGMIVTSDILDIPNLKEGRLYVWESVISGPLGLGVKNIDGKSYLGSQVRDFEELLEKYDAPNDSSIAIGRLLNRYSSIIETNDFKKKFTDIFNKYNGIFYDWLPTELFSTLFVCCRNFRTETDRYLFCSEMLAYVYKELNILDSSVNPRNIMPMNFAGYFNEGLDNRIPLITELPLLYVTTRAHI